jgi:hypothetical protein
MNLRAGTRLLAASITAFAFAAGTAQAAPTLSPSGPYSDDDAVLVTGTVPAPFAATATTYAIAECNTGGAPSTWGQRCNATAGGTPARYTAPLELVSGTYNASITLDDGFADFDFSGLTTPSTTTSCKTLGNDQCSVIVSFYRLSGGNLLQLGADFKTITF